MLDQLLFILAEGGVLFLVNHFVKAVFNIDLCCQVSW